MLWGYPFGPGLQAQDSLVQVGVVGFGSAQITNVSTGGGEHVKASVGQQLNQTATDQRAQQRSGFGHRLTDDLCQDPRAHGNVQQSDPPQQATLLGVEQVVGGVDRLGQGVGRTGITQPDHGALHGDLLDEQRQSAGCDEESSYVVALSVEIDAMSPGGLDSVQEELDCGARQFGPRQGHRKRVDSHHAFAGLPCPGQRRDDDLRLRRGIEDALQESACSSRVQIQSIQDQETARSIDRSGEGAGQGVSGDSFRIQRQQALSEDVIETRQMPSIDPGGIRVFGGDMPSQEGLAATGSSGKGHPPTLRQGGSQRALRLSTTETRGEHVANLSPYVGDYVGLPMYGAGSGGRVLVMPDGGWALQG